MIGRLHLLPMLASSRRHGPGLASVRVAGRSWPKRSPEDMDDLVVTAFGDEKVVHVGGTVRRQNGFVLPLTSRAMIAEAQIVFEWRWGYSVARHRISFDLTDIGQEEDPFWSMDAAYWPLAGYAETRRTDFADRRRMMAVAALTEDDLPQSHQRTFSTGFHQGAFVINERLTLHAVAYDRARDLARRRLAERAQAGTAA